jgi:hypothetical protein
MLTMPIDFGGDMKVSELEVPLLNFWVATSEGLDRTAVEPALGERHDADSGSWHPANYHPATDWSQGGPIVAREWYALEETLNEWFGPRWPFMKMFSDQPLMWFMRAYVSSRFGDEVEEL